MPVELDINNDGAIDISIGGTGATTANQARVNLGAEAVGTADNKMAAHESFYDHAAILTADQSSALAGTEGTPSGTNKFVTDSDPRIPTTDEKAGISALTGADPAVPRSALVYQAADYTALRAITGQTAGKQASVAYRSTAGDGGGGMFRWDSSDLSAQVTADTQSGIYVAPTSDATGASGAWVRVYSGAVDVRWFGMSPTLADNTTALVAAIANASSLVIPLGTYPFTTGGIVIDKNIEIEGQWLPVLSFTGSGTFITFGQASYLSDLTAGYYRIRLANLIISGGASAGVLINNSGVRHFEIDNVRTAGGVSAVATEGAWDSATIKSSRFLNTTSHVLQIKQRNNNMKISSTALLGGAGNGAYLSTSGAELKGITFDKVDFEGNAGAVNITGNTGNIDILNSWFENNTIYNIRVENVGTNKYVINIKGSQITGAGVDVLIGTDAAGTMILGGEISGNEFVDSDLVLIGGGKIENMVVSPSNLYSATATLTMPTPNLPTTSEHLPAHRTMPLYGATPSFPFGSGDTKGATGEMRWAQSRLGIKTTGWRFAQLHSVGDATTLASLPAGATPSASPLLVASTSNGAPTTVTALTNGYPSQQLIVVGRDGGNTTIANGTNIKLAGAADFVLGDNDVLHLVCVDGTLWVEVSRSNN